MADVHTSTFLNSANATYISKLYAKYLDDPRGIDKSWASFFDDLDEDMRAVLDELHGASWGLHDNERSAIGTGADAAPFSAESPQEQEAAGMEQGAHPLSAVSDDDLRQATMDSIRALMLIRAYRVRGHLLANLDPLDLKEETHHPELDPATYGFDEEDYDRPIFINHVLGMETATLSEILAVLRETYCDTIGVEFLHIQDPEQKSWLQARIEGARNHTDFTVRGKRAILQRLISAEKFEQFLQTKYTGTKRFGLEGAESLIPAIEQIMKRGGQLGLKEIILGMAHRGRLNVLTNVMGKPYTAVFSEFQGNAATPDSVQGSGDVKYHLGTSSDRDFDGNTIHLSLTANPSHLEAVNPVVIGKVRAKQKQHEDEDHTKVMSMLLHGDAAFAGQGLVAETLMISELKGYRVGGTIHFVINNQIGFTTMPQFSRSGPYATDVALMIQAPIFHVNGDDPEAVVHVARLAAEFRQKFKKDVVIDMICYRRHGHNEGDEPSFTQPVMYDKIRNHHTTQEIYADQLVREGVLTRDEVDNMIEEFNGYLEDEFEAAHNFKPNKADMLDGRWEGLEVAPNMTEPRRGMTGVKDDILQHVGEAITRYPEGFNINPKIKRQLDAKKKMLDSGEKIDWATAESLAFGTLCYEGYPVRLSGQDSGRGTFSQRHSVLHDQKTGERYVPLNNIGSKQASFEVHDSPLSEAAVLGFEYGYSLAEPMCLTLWEAQFGDFVNGAQVLIDQFVCSGEAKWLRMSGLVMLLPHGYEGQGPEHSSARIERFLQNSAEDNWQIVNCTTPSNYFHVLRRQMHRKFRKPLIIMTPKSLLRHKACVSKLSDFAGESTFHRVLYEDTKLAPNKDIRRVVICSGKVYYDLARERDERGIKDITILRLEQLYPFPGNALGEELKKYPNADVIWCQEEPQNQGAWHFVDRRIEQLLDEIGHNAHRPVYVGRPEAAAPATGLLKNHNEQQARLVDAALSLDRTKESKRA